MLASLPVQALGDQTSRTPPEGPHLDKIDHPVRASIRTGADTEVLIIAADQVLPPPSGYEAFTLEHAGARRSDIRSRMVRDLKRTAADAHARIVGVLDAPDEALGLWIVSGVAATLSPEEILRAAGLDEVGLIVHAGSLPPRRVAPPPPVSDIVVPTPRGPFDPARVAAPWNLVQIGAQRAWEAHGVAGEGVVVAILDTGARYTHPDLRDALWSNADEIPNNQVDDDGNGYVDDLYGFDFQNMAPDVGGSGIARNHGTFVSGIVAGDGSSGTVTGVAPRARVMLLRSAGTLVGSALAHQYAIEQGADVLNMSFSIPGLGNARAAWRMIADHSVAAGLVLVSGAGNFRQSADLPEQLRTPEGIPSVIGVGGVDRTQRPVPFSSMGPVEWSSVRLYADHPRLLKPDVAAFPGPGYPILDPDGGYIDPNSSIAGNSFSSPHAAGVAALVLSAHPELPAWEVGDILRATARDIGDPGPDHETGAGLIDAFAAVQEAVARRSGPR